MAWTDQLPAGEVYLTAITTAELRYGHHGQGESMHVELVEGRIVRPVGHPATRGQHGTGGQAVPLGLRGELRGRLVRVGRGSKPERRRATGQAVPGRD